MSYMKRFAEQVAAEQGKDNIMDPEVVAEAQRRIDLAMGPVIHPPTQQTTYWQSYRVLTNGEVQLCRAYDQGHSMKCKWTAFLNDHNAHGTPGKWRVAEDTDTRKVVAYDDQIVKMVVFELITIDTLVEPPDGISSGRDGHYFTLGECVATGHHLTNCDDDGYCNYCGEQE